MRDLPACGQPAHAAAGSVTVSPWTSPVARAACCWWRRCSWPRASSPPRHLPSTPRPPRPPRPRRRPTRRPSPHDRHRRRARPKARTSSRSRSRAASRTSHPPGSSAVSATPPSRTCARPGTRRRSSRHRGRGLRGWSSAGGRTPSPAPSGRGYGPRTTRPCGPWCRSRRSASTTASTRPSTTAPSGAAGTSCSVRRPAPIAAGAAPSSGTRQTVARGSGRRTPTGCSGAADDQQLLDVAEGPDGLVAVGTRGAALAGAVWRSDREGDEWRLVTDDAFRDASPTAVAAGPAGLVAVGTRTTGGETRATVWTSDVGDRWRRSDAALPAAAEPSAIAALRPLRRRRRDRRRRGDRGGGVDVA